MATNTFLKSKIIESYAKQVTVTDQNGNATKEKHMFFSILLKASNDVTGFDLDINSGDSELNSSILLPLIVKAGYADNLSDSQLADILNAVDSNSVNLYRPLTFSNTPQAGDYMYIDAPNSDDIIVPYVGGRERVFRFEINITGYDGSSPTNPDVRAIWKHAPLVVYLCATNVARGDRASLSLAVEFTDCQDSYEQLSSFIDTLVSSDNQTYGITSDDTAFLKSILDGTRGASSDPNACVPPSQALPDPVAEPLLPQHSLMFEIANLDKLLAYLKNQVIKYKSDIVTVSTNGQCTAYVKCLIKSWVGLKKLQELTNSQLQAHYRAAQHIAAQYLRLKAEYDDAVEAARGIRASMSNWIKSTLDINFKDDLSDIVSSNNVGSGPNAIAFVNTQKYQKYYIDSNGNRSSAFIHLSDD